MIILKNKYISISLIIFFSLIPYYPYAYQIRSSGPFYIEKRLIKAQEKIDLILPVERDRLFDSFKIECNFINPNFNQQYPVIISINNDQFILKQLHTNVVSIVGSKFQITNFDDKDSVYLECIANYNISID